MDIFDGKTVLVTGHTELDYVQTINNRLKPADQHHATVLDLFAGAGGLGLGFEAHGFKTIGFEKERDYCDTYRQNLGSDCFQIELSEDTNYPPADIIVGGPPCQPFSVSGKQTGLDDGRDGFPAFIAAVRQLKPTLFLFENVRGMLYRNKWYLDEIVTVLSRLGYIVEYKLLNAVEYGVPQNRKRLIVVGHRGGYRFPSPVHNTITSGEALGALAHKATPDAKFLTASMDAYVAKYERASQCKRPRDLHLNKPSRTVTCRNLAGATGDMMRVRLPDGRRRRLTVREAARLQSFPDWFQFSGSETSQFNQIGNAVPPMFAYHLAASVHNYLDAPERWLSVDEIVSQNNAQPKQMALL